MKWTAPFGIVVLVLALAWIPIILRFYRQWRNRKNPVSLAICLILFFIIYGDIGAFLIYQGVLNSTVVRLAWEGVQLCICAYFHTAFWIADRRFRDERRAKDQ